MRKRLIIIATLAALVLAIAAPAFAGPPAGAGKAGKPAGIACQQAGIATLQGAGLLSFVAKNGIEAGTFEGDEFQSLGTLPFKTVLALHRSNPELFSGGVFVVLPGGAFLEATWCAGL